MSESFGSMASSSVKGCRQLCLSPKARLFRLAGKVPSKQKRKESRGLFICDTTNLPRANPYDKNGTESDQCKGKGTIEVSSNSLQKAYPGCSPPSQVTWGLGIHPTLFSHFEEYLKETRQGTVWVSTSFMKEVITAQISLWNPTLGA